MYEQAAASSAASSSSVQAAAPDSIFVRKLTQFTSTLPLNRAGGLSLQMQQQQQIQQQRSQSFDLENEKGKAYEDILPAQLVDYSNIDELLRDYYDALNREHPINKGKITFARADKSTLQNFFHTWINANPEVDARHVIKKMTMDAARMLLKHHRQFSGGINPYNLPKGFFTQRDVNGLLVLGYKATLQYTTDSNPLTLKLTSNLPKPEECLGNFRQFGDSEEWLVLFSKLQPAPDNVEQLYANFIAETNLKFNAEQAIKIQKNWHLFQTLYSFQGQECFSNFEKMIEVKFEVLKNTLLADPQLALFQETINDEASLIALGQILFKYGHFGLKTFCDQLGNLNTLSLMLFDGLKNHYLAKCQTFAPLLEKDSLDAFQNMRTFFSEEPGAIGFWNMFLEQHMAAVDWEDFAQMWKGFNYFINKISGLGIKDELFQLDLKSIRLSPQNMLTCFDRILLCLDKIDTQIEFLKSIERLDFTEGGAPYAIRHEGFVVVQENLALRDFHQGAPTYKPNVKNLLNPDFDLFQMRRALACQPHLNAQNYALITDEHHGLIKDNSPLSKIYLLLILHTQFEAANYQNLDKFLTEEENSQALGLIANQFLNIFYIMNQPLSRYPLGLMQKIVHNYNENPAQWQELLKLNHLWLFDCLQVLEQHQKLDEASIERIKSFFMPEEAKHPHLRQGLMLASLFQVDKEALKNFLQGTQNLKANVRLELQSLINQLLSLNLAEIDISAFNWNSIWSDILYTINQMNQNHENCQTMRQGFMQHLSENGLKFKSSLAGDYRRITQDDISHIEGMQFFSQHQTRLGNFFLNHIAIPSDKPANELVRPIVNFFRRLQMNKTYINEIEPLLATLGSSLESNLCWTTAFFNQLLQALEPKDAQSAFPIAILQAIITEDSSPFKPKQIDHLVTEFPKELASRLQNILAKSATFTRYQQTGLVKLTLRTHAQGQEDDMNSMMEGLSEPQYASLRGLIISFLLCSPVDSIISNFKICEKLISLNDSSELLRTNWPKTCQLWLEVLNKDPKYTHLIELVLNTPDINQENKALILHIIAWTSIPSSTLISATSSLHLDKGTRRISKAEKLFERLKSLSMPQLNQLASIYPGKPAPDAPQLLQFLKSQGPELEIDTQDLIKGSLRLPQKDFAALSVTREQDFLRMLENTRVTKGSEAYPFSEKDSLRLTMMFKYLKQLENGEQCLPKSPKAIHQMSQQELKTAFEALSVQDRTHSNDILTIQIWAILFEVIGRTTGKYPHLAQQFSLIANEVQLKDANSSILQLKTGEGKSHFVALRAARHVGMGNKVDVCTAKWSLAQRDLLDYKPFFDYLEITTANIQSSTENPQTYEEAQVVYTTPGDFSLFLDNHAYRGQPVKFPEKKPVCLGDEFDFLFYEGQKVQYNYAQHTGISPKEMSWFYRAINQFHNSHQDIRDIDHKLLQECFIYLLEQAGHNDERHSYINSLDPQNLAAWIQSAHEAATMVMGVNFTTRLEQVKIGEEEYPLREIYPLTKDMQAAVGSTFSHGVHQLLAERLNQQAQEKQQPQNHHVHPESHIVSSQVFSQRLKDVWSKWEGFTGTVSATQAKQLNDVYQTQVLVVPTNQKDLRKWPDPHFYDEELKQIEAIAMTIKSALKEKKSILWCCETDQKVLQMQPLIKKYFTEAEWNEHFMVFTNESHDTAAQVLSQKKEKEGLMLGQKERGVVLMAAGFGRGDNVDVEMVILQSVHDENDLGQKGGRTARNGEEGDVRQFYMTGEIEKVFNYLLDSIESKDSPYAAYAASINQQIQSTYQKPIALKDRFQLVLRLREFLQSVDNQASSYYHESKAIISSKALECLEKIQEPDVREKAARQLSALVEELEKKWATIKAEHPNTKASIVTLKEYLETNITQLLQDIFNSEQIHLTFGEYQALEFILNTGHKEKSQAHVVLEAIQTCLLGIEDWPSNQEVWNGITEKLTSLDENKISMFYQHISKIHPLSFAEFEAQLDRASVQSLFVTDLTAAKEFNKFRLETAELYQRLIPSLAEPLTKCLGQLSPDVYQDVLEYLKNPGVSPLDRHVQHSLPMIAYVASIPAVEEQKARTYFKQPLLRDSLLNLSPLCLTGLTQMNPKTRRPQTVALSAEHLSLIKNFLDKQIPDVYEDQYAFIFTNLAKACEHQTEKRLRWLSSLTSMLGHVDNKKEWLKTLSQLMVHFKDEPYYQFFDVLLARIGQMYEEKKIDHTQVKNFFDKILSKCPDLLQALVPLNAMLNRKGKEFFSNLNNMLDLLSTQNMIDYATVLEKFALKTATKKKSDEIESFKWTLDHLQTFSEKPHSEKITGILNRLNTEQFDRALDEYHASSVLQNHELLFEFFISHLKNLGNARNIFDLLHHVYEASERNAAIDIQSCLTKLDEYLNIPINISRFTELMGLEKLPIEYKVQEFWMNPERIHRINQLNAEQFEGLKRLLNAPELFISTPKLLDDMLSYLESETFKLTHDTRSWHYSIKKLIEFQSKLSIIHLYEDYKTFMAKMQVYEQNPRQLKVLRDMIGWHQLPDVTPDLSSFHQIWLKNSRVENIAKLSNQKYNCLFEAYKDSKIREIFVKYPETLDSFIAYLSSTGFKAKHAKIFSTTLHKIILCQQQPEQLQRCLEKLQELITDKRKIKTTLELIDSHPDFAVEIVFNGLAYYIKTNAAKKSEIKQAVDIFYTKRSPVDSKLPMTLKQKEQVKHFLDLFEACQNALNEGTTADINLVTKDQQKKQNLENLIKSIAEQINHPSESANEAIKILANNYSGLPDDTKKIVTSELILKQNPLQMQPAIDLFDFTKASPERITWMQLLHEGVFITDENIPGTTWSEQANEDYYTKNLGQYSDFFKKELAFSASLTKTRPLEITKLQSIPEELAKIAEIKPQVPQLPLSFLEKEIKATVDKYKNAWFKNNSRIRQIKEIEKKLELELKNEANNPYLKLMEYICNFKLEIQDLDRLQNKSSIFRWFNPVNKNGQSRLLNTLNTMHDTVLRAWLQDTKLMHSFDNQYAIYIWEKTEFQLKKFKEALESWKAREAEITSYPLGWLFSTPIQTNDAVEKCLNILNSACSMEEKVNQLHALSDSPIPAHLNVLLKDILAYAQDLNKFKVRNN